MSGDVASVRRRDFHLAGDEAKSKSEDQTPAVVETVLNFCVKKSRHPTSQFQSLIISSMLVLTVTDQ